MDGVVPVGDNDGRDDDGHSIGVTTFRTLLLCSFWNTRCGVMSVDALRFLVFINGGGDVTIGIAATLDSVVVFFWTKYLRSLLSFNMLLVPSKSDRVGGRMRFDRRGRDGDCCGDGRSDDDSGASNVGDDDDDNHRFSVSSTISPSSGVFSSDDAIRRVVEKSEFQNRARRI